MQCPEDMHSYWLFLPAVRMILLSDPCRCFLIYTCSQMSVGINVGMRVYLYRRICSNIDCNNRELPLLFYQSRRVFLRKSSDLTK